MLGNVRTQFTDGFDYSATPQKQNSAFFAPAYVLLSPGLMYKPNQTFDVFVSPVTSRWVVVSGGHKDLRRFFAFSPLFLNFRNVVFQNDISRTIFQFWPKIIGIFGIGE